MILSKPHNSSVYRFFASLNITAYECLYIAIITQHEVLKKLFSHRCHFDRREKSIFI